MKGPTEIKDKLQALKTTQFWMSSWPVIACGLLTLCLSWLAIFKTLTFYMVFVCFLFVALLICGFAALWFVKIWKKPDAFRTSAKVNLTNRANRFWLAMVLLHSCVAVGTCLLGWFLLWTIGPKIWVLAVALAVLCMGLFGFVGCVLRPIPATLALCWSQALPGGSRLRRWINEFSLKHRLDSALEEDKRREQPKILDVVRVLEAKQQAGFGKDEPEWIKTQWLEAGGKKVWATSLGVMAVFLPVLVLFFLMIGEVQFAAIPPGFEQNQRLARAIFPDSQEFQSPADQNLNSEPSPNSSEGETPKSNGTSGAESDSADAGQNGSDGSTGGTSQDANSSRGEDAASSAGNGSSQMGQEGNTRSSKQSASNSLQEPEYVDETGESPENEVDVYREDPSKKGQEPTSQEARDGLPQPNLPGSESMPSSGQNSEQSKGKTSKEGQGEGEKGQAGVSDNKQGEGKGAGANPSKQEGQKDGMGQSRSQSNQQPGATSGGKNGQGNNGGPEQLEYAGGGGPREGKPGPPSPPDPESQELVKIEVPPVETGRLKRKALTEKAIPSQNRAGSEQRAPGQQPKNEVLQVGETQQILPNWIQIMLYQKANRKPPPQNNP